MSREYLGGHSNAEFRMQSYHSERTFISAAFEGTVVAWNLSDSAIVWKTKQDVQVFSFAMGEGVVVLRRSDGIVKVLKLDDG